MIWTGSTLMNTKAPAMSAAPVWSDYEDVLHGKPGYELDEVNADGRIQQVLKTIPPTPGRTSI
jgi:hypothetical protein